MNPVEPLYQPLVRSWQPWSVRFLIPSLLLWAGGVVSGQVTTAWDSDTGGLFQDSGNWDNGVPGSDDTAIFDLNGLEGQGLAPYTVTFNADAATDFLSIRTDQVHFSVSDGVDDFAYTLGSRFEIGFGSGENAVAVFDRGTINGTARLFLGNDGGGHFTISNGALLDLDGRFDLGFNPSGNGTLVVTGQGTQAIVGGGGSNTIGRRGDGALEVLDGAVMTINDNLQIGARNVDATVLVDDAELNITRDLSIGRDGSSAANPGTGRVEIRNGGVVNVGLELELGVEGSENRAAEGFLLITGAGSRMEVERDMTVGDGGGPTYFGRIEIEDGGLLETGAFGNNRDAWIGLNGGIGEVIITGAGSEWVHDSNQVHFGEGTSSGLLRVENGGAATFTGSTEFTRFYADSRLEIASGTLATTDLEFLPDSIFSVTLDSSDQAAARIVLREGSRSSGLLDIGADVEFELTLASGFTANLGDVFVLIDYEDWNFGEFANLTQGQIIAAGVYEFQIDYEYDEFGFFNGTEVALITVAIPEPNLALLGIVLLGAMRVVRRPRRRLVS